MARAERPTLPERVLAIDVALTPFPHAFGGALALAYHAEPRATRDIDCNVFVEAARAPEVLAPLQGLGADVREAAAVALRDGQVRVWWDETPIDLFFAYDPFHTAAKRDAIRVPFAAATIQVLSASHLCVCKTVFDRPRDWVDIEAMIEAEADLNAAEILRWVGRICGDTDTRFTRIATLLTR